MNYENLIEELESGAEISEECRDKAAEAMAFVLSLHNMFKKSGVSLNESPECYLLENLIDGVHGELAAACVFLSEESFAGVPNILRAIGQSVAQKDVGFVDAEGISGPSVPKAVRNGFSKLAQRIESVREKQVEIAADISSISK